MFLCRAQSTNAKGRPMCLSPTSLACPMPSTGSKGISPEEIGALWGAWAAWLMGGWMFGLSGRKVRTAGSDELTQFVSHPHLPQCCWAVLDSSWAFPPRPSHPPAHSAFVLWGSNYIPGGRPMICSGSSTGAGIHGFTAEDEAVRKAGSVRAWIIPRCCKACMGCAGAHTPPTEPQPRLTINHPAINPPCFASSQLECSICYSMSMWQWQSLMRHIGLWIGSSIPTGSTVTVAQNTALEKSISCLFAGAGLQLGSGLIVSSLSFP